MKNIRLIIIASSLMLCLWLTAAFTAQTQPASPLNSSIESAETHQKETDNLETDEAEIAEPIVLMK